ncbi:hypothetical protein L2E82_14998 [Cichorium intybus]|uniref:Uncharacterized protein n=1 Tax=Cichorium intybus TaxID=13427 RepID=A0ACB9F206_CICIN|nr:hypothetical protein L2E82_14998 [Cichorium intybus]
MLKGNNQGCCGGWHQKREAFPIEAVDFLALLVLEFLASLPELQCFFSLDLPLLHNETSYGQHSDLQTGKRLTDPTFVKQGTQVVDWYSSR